MKYKVGISIILTLLMVTSTMAATAVEKKYKPYEADSKICPPEDIEVTKLIWNGEGWCDYYEAEIDEIVLFNITITYHKNCENGLMATDIVVMDLLPEEFTYIQSYPFEESYIDENNIYWNLTEDYDIVLYDDASISFEFEAQVNTYGEFENCVEVNAWETGCEWALYGTDCATIYAEQPPPLLFEKLVYDPSTGEWVDLLDAPIQIGSIVKFKISITYQGIDDINLMKCMIVDDYLPGCCLEYFGNEIFNYPSSLFEDPVITVDEDLKYVNYDWSNKMFNLFVGETIEIIFETVVVEYCYNTVENYASVNLWSCYNCPNPVHLYGEDYAYVNCYPQDISFEKTVWDPELEEWTDFLYSYIGEDIRFKIELTYYGNYNLEEITVIDELPCCLIYDYNANILESFISEDLKTIYWNFTEPLGDGETISIEFDALATDTTGCGCGLNTATVYAYEYGYPFTASDTAEVDIDVFIPTYPPCPPVVTGDTYGVTGEVLTFNAISSDPEGDDIYYMFDWDDEGYSDWVGPYESGEEIEITHSWDYEGTYEVRAKAKDVNDLESGWSYYPWIVTIEESIPNYPPNTPEISGPAYGRPEEVLTFNAITSDPEEDDIYYMFDWDDESPNEWLGPYESGEQIDITHYWPYQGVYDVTVKAKDINEQESEWSSPLTVTIDTIDITITIPRKLFIGRICASIENTGGVALENVDWEISITKAGILRKAPTPAQGTIGNLDIGAKQQVCKGRIFGIGLKSIKLRVGRIEGIVTASVGDYSQSIGFKGLILGRIIFIRPAEIPS